MNVPAAILRQAYAQLVANEQARVFDFTPGSHEPWLSAMRARVNFGIYVIRELDRIDAINVDVETAMSNCTCADCTARWASRVQPPVGEHPFETWWKSTRGIPYWMNVEKRQARDIWYFATGGLVPQEQTK